MTIKYKDPKLWLISFDVSQFAKTLKAIEPPKIGQESTPLSPRNPT